MASVASTIVVCIAVGVLLEHSGAVNLQPGMLAFGEVWGATAATVYARWVLICFFIGCAGCTFVTNQFWFCMLLVPNVLGIANAAAAGWRNLGGGGTQIFMMLVLSNPVFALASQRTLSGAINGHLQLATHFKTYSQMGAASTFALARVFMNPTPGPWAESQVQPFQAHGIPCQNQLRQTCLSRTSRSLP